MSNIQDAELGPRTRASTRNSAGLPKIDKAGSFHRPATNHQDPTPALTDHGTDRITRLLWQDDRELDDLERDLQSRSTSDTVSRRLFHAYAKFKTKPSGLLFNSLLSFRICGKEDVSLSNYEYFDADE